MKDRRVAELLRTLMNTKQKEVVVLSPEQFNNLLAVLKILHKRVYTMERVQGLAQKPKEVNKFIKRIARLERIKYKRVRMK